MQKGCIFDVLKTCFDIMLLTLLQTASLAAPDTCTAGYYVSQAGLCEPCPEGTFRSQSDQVYRCEKCRVADGVKNEVILLPCTATDNTLIGCKGGFFRLKNDSAEAHCAPCSVCGLGSNLYRDYEVRRCSEYEDTTCCQEPWDVLLAEVCVDKRALPTTTGIATHALDDQPDTTNSAVDDGQPVKAGLRNLSGGSNSLLFSLSSKLMVLLIFILFQIHFLVNPL